MTKPMMMMMLLLLFLLHPQQLSIHYCFFFYLVNAHREATRTLSSVLETSASLNQTAIVRA